MAESPKRYRASRQYLWFALVAVAISLFSGWVALRWDYAWIAASLALASAILLFLLALQPAIEIHGTHLRVGKRQITWSKIRRLDRVALMPLVMRVTLADHKEVMLVYAGDAESVASLVRQLRAHSREALIDGVPYRQFWGEELQTAMPEPVQAIPVPRYPLLLEDDEAEVERMFQRLRSGGKLEDGGPNPKGSGPKPSPRTSGDS